MKSVLATLCKGQPAVRPRYIKKCQKVLNSAVHAATGEQPHFLMFNRRQQRLIGVELPQLRQNADLEVVLEVVRRTSIEQARKWRSRANIGRKNQRVEVDQLVWVKKDYTTLLSDRKLGEKWVDPYKVKEVLRDGGAYQLENVFNGVRIQRAADKVKPYVGQENILLQPREMFFRNDSEEEEEVEPRPVRERRPPRRYIEVEPRPVREHRPPRRYIEKDDPRQVQADAAGERERDEESEVEKRPVRPKRQRRRVRRYIEKME